MVFFFSCRWTPGRDSEERVESSELRPESLLPVLHKNSRREEKVARGLCSGEAADSQGLRKWGSVHWQGQGGGAQSCIGKQEWLGAQQTEEQAQGWVNWSHTNTNTNLIFKWISMRHRSQLMRLLFHTSPSLQKDCLRPRNHLKSVNDLKIIQLSFIEQDDLKESSTA